MVKILSTYALSMLVLSGCGVQPAQNSVEKAYVSQEQANDAFSIVYDIDYLPFAYVEDGCYARSLYMSMELAVNHIPSSAHYIYGELHPNANTSWSYHVAPLIKVDTDEAWILDPALESEPLRLSAWIKKNFPRGRYQTRVRAGSAYFDESSRVSAFDKRMIENFEEMPTFLTTDIKDSCEVMLDYIVREDQDSYKAKQARLIARTAELVAGLKTVKKLSGNTSSGKGACDTAIAKGLANAS